MGVEVRSIRLRAAAILLLCVIGPGCDLRTPAPKAGRAGADSPGPVHSEARESIPATDAGAAPWSDPAADGKCGRWSLAGLRLGLTIAEARRAHPGLHRDAARDGHGVGSIHYDWPVPGAPGVVENVVIAGEAGDDGRVLSYSVDLTESVSGLDDLRSRLEERWGNAVEPEGLQRILVAARWIDAGCDVEAELRSISRRDDPRLPARLVAVVTSLAAREALARRKEAEREERARQMPW